MTRIDMDPFCVLLAVANATVAMMNMLVWVETREPRDLVGAVAWFGSALYWVVRGRVPR